MADETRNAEVQLTADISGYTQPMGQATQQTNKLTDSVNKLASSLDGITKRAGKKLMLFAAGDAAAMAAYTAAAAKYEKQLTTLRAQTTIANKDISLYKKGMEDIARQLPITGAAVAELVTQISKMGVTSERQAVQMARTFTQLAAATGEDIGSLTQGLIELSRQMGTLGNGAQGIQNFADSLTTVSTTAGVSATAVLNFAQAIAPMARAAGIGQKEVIGISTAFTKAGADGFAAANTFNTMVTDITRSVMSGSPEIGKYSSTIGATIDQFKAMDPVERVVRLFEAVNKAGPDSVKLLDRLGYDGIRAAKSIQAVANESGGLRKAIQESVGAYGNGKTAAGAEAAFGSLESAMTRFRNNLEQIAATLGTTLLPIATAFMNVLNKGLETVNRIAGPLLVVAGAIGGILAPLAAAFGGLMTMMGPLSSLMIAMTLFRLSPMRAMFQGIKEGAAQNLAARAGTPYVASTSMGQRLAAGEKVPAFRTVPYNAGLRAGSMIQPSSTQVLAARGATGVGALAPGAYGPRMPTAADVPNRVGQVALRSGIAASNAVNTWYLTPTKQLITNAGMADSMNRVSYLGNASEAGLQKVGALKAAWSDPRGFLAAWKDRGATSSPLPQPSAPLQTPGQAMAAALRNGATPGEALAAANAAKALQNVATSVAPVAAAEAEKVAATKLTTVGLKDLAKSLAATGKAAAGLPVAYAKMGAQVAVQGAAMAGKNVLSMVGGLVGGGAVTGGVIVGGLAAGLAAKSAMDSTKSTYDNSRNIAATNEALGIATEPLHNFSSAVIAATDALRDLSSAKKGFDLTSAERSGALSGDFTDRTFASLKNVDEVKAYVQSLGELSGEQARSVGKDAFKALGGNYAVYLEAMNGMGYTKADNTGIQKALLAGASESQQNAWHNVLFSALDNVFNPLGVQNGINASPWAAGETHDQVNAAVAAMLGEANDNATRYGDKAGGQTLAARLMEAGDTVFSNKDAVTQQTWLSAVEKSLLGDGQELGVKKTANGTMSLAGVELLDGASFMKALEEAAKRDEGSPAAGLYGQLFGANTTSTAAANDAILKALSSGTLSPVEAKMQSTDLGKYARTNKDILNATEGGGIGDPVALDKAMSNMLNYVTKNGTAYGDTTKSLQSFKKNIDDTSSYTYTLAQSVQVAAERMGGINARREGGMLGQLGYQIKTVGEKIDNPDQRLPGESTDSLRQQMEGYEQEVINKKIEAYQTIRNYNISFARQEKSFEIQMVQSRQDFHRQMVYNEEDFARNMRRAANDAAKSIYDPMQRVFNGNTMSMDQFLYNQKDQNKKIQQQLKDVAALKKMGVSQAAIDTYGLDDAQNYALVRRWVDQGLGKGQIKDLNKVTTTRREGAAANMELQDSTRNAREDQARNTGRQYDQFTLNMDRSRKAMQRSQRQALWDLNQYGKDLMLSEKDIDSLLQEQVNTALGTARTIVRGSINEDVIYIGDKLKELTDLVAAAKVANPTTTTPPKPIPEPPESDGTTPTGAGTDNQAATGLTTGTADSMTSLNQDKYARSQSGSYTVYKLASGKYAAKTSYGKIVEVPDGFIGDGFNRDSWWTANVVMKNLGLATGGIAKKPTWRVFGEAGPEAVLPLRGVEGHAAMSEIAHQITMNMAKGYSTSGHNTPTVYRGANLVINNHTEFRDIQVVAQDPNEMARKLKEKARLENLRRGSNASISA